MVEVDYHEMFIRLTYGKTYTGGQLVCYQFYSYLREMLIPLFNSIRQTLDR